MGTTEPLSPARHILIVEDDRNHRWVVRRVLESSLGKDIVVEEAETGEKALERALGHPDLDLVLLDLALPGLGGLDVLKRLRADPRTRRLPVVVLAGSEENEDRRLAFECGATSFVSKLETPERMLRLLGSLFQV